MMSESVHVVCPACDAVNRIPEARLAKLDTEAHQAVGARFNIRSIPTLAVFKGGREVARQAGAMGMNDIVRWVRSQT